MIDRSSNRVNASFLLLFFSFFPSKKSLNNKITLQSLLFRGSKENYFRENNEKLIPWPNWTPKSIKHIQTTIGTNYIRCHGQRLNLINSYLKRFPDRDCGASSVPYINTRIKWTIWSLTRYIGHGSGTSDGYMGRRKSIDISKDRKVVEFDKGLQSSEIRKIVKKSDDGSFGLEFEFLRVEKYIYIQPRRNPKYQNESEILSIERQIG